MCVHVVVTAVRVSFRRILTIARHRVSCSDTYFSPRPPPTRTTRADPRIRKRRKRARTPVRFPRPFVFLAPRRRPRNDFPAPRQSPAATAAAPCPTTPPPTTRHPAAAAPDVRPVRETPVWAARAGGGDADSAGLSVTTRAATEELLLNATATQGATDTGGHRYDVRRAHKAILWDSRNERRNRIHTRRMPRDRCVFSILKHVI